MSEDVPVDAEFICNKRTVFRDKVNGACLILFPVISNNGSGVCFGTILLLVFKVFTAQLWNLKLYFAFHASGNVRGTEHTAPCALQNTL
jgi:hypothetical protein